MARREREPWLLAASVSLGLLSADEITALYAKRMQIEQSFRDLKSHRYGAAFEDSLTRDPRRLEMLLLIHLLATLAAWLEGLAVVTALLAAHPAGTTRRSRHSRCGWGGSRCDDTAHTCHCRHPKPAHAYAICLRKRHEGREDVGKPQ